jgi:hypothetical protein
MGNSTANSRDGKSSWVATEIRSPTSPTTVSASSNSALGSGSKVLSVPLS